MNDTTPATSRILVWDLPVRIFHWMLAAAFAGAWLTADSERWRDLHILLGYTAGLLAGLRVVWGFLGTRHARFASFVHGPRRVAAYLRSLVSGAPQHTTGHNPAGGWAIVALIVLTGAIVATGLAVESDAGPKSLDDVHEALATAMLVVVGLHVAGVAIGSLVHRENLVRAMVTGRKRGAPGEAIRGPRWLAAAVLIAAVAGVWTGVLPAPGLPEGAGLTAITASAPAVRHDGRSDDD
ncbi:hypothetical protein BURK1_02446 [Burkholderiales bacterium]|nr:hypothetical protein BURK1_02446 [Burkholderiales bacterium]